MKEEILAKVAPCGLHCGKCFAFAKGDIRAAAAVMKDNLGNFEPYAARFANLLDARFDAYSEFKKMLDYFAEVSCEGCRKEKCKFYKNCRVRTCAMEEKHINFCYECEEFPCNHSGLDENLHQRSIAINRRIQKIGIDAYYEEIKEIPRY